jgi:hypothetical protein
MVWMTNNLKAGIRAVRGAFYPDVVRIQDVSYVTGASMYRKTEETHFDYARSGAAALNEVSRHDESGPGGYHNLGSLQVALKASSTGSGGPTNESLLLRTGSAGSVWLLIENRNWNITRVAKNVEADELICDVEKMT